MAKWDIPSCLQVPRLAPNKTGTCGHEGRSHLAFFREAKQGISTEQKATWEGTQFWWTRGIQTRWGICRTSNKDHINPSEVPRVRPATGPWGSPIRMVTRPGTTLCWAFSSSTCRRETTTKQHDRHGQSPGNASPTPTRGSAMGQEHAIDNWVNSTLCQKCQKCEEEKQPVSQKCAIRTGGGQTGGSLK